MSSYAKAVASIEAALDGPLAPRATQGGTAAAAAMARAQRLAGMVRDEGADSIGRYLDPLDRDQLYALTVALAAMVDVDKTPNELLGWLEPLGLELERTVNRARYVAGKTAA